MKKQNRNKYIKTMCTPKEKEEIIANAKGGNVSEFMRLLGLNNKRIRIKETKADAALVEQVRRVGVSLNQLAKAVNYHIKTEKHIELAKLNFYLKACNEMLEKILKESIKHDR